MITDTWKVYIRDSSGNPIAEADRLAKFSGELRFNSVGKWSLASPYNSKAAALLTWKGGVVVTRNDVAVFSGLVKNMTRNWDNRNGDQLVATGEDDLTILSSRLAYPVVTGPPYSGQAYDTRTGAAESVIKQYVNYNVGPLAKPERAWPGLTVATDAGTGTTVTGNARFQFLLDLLAPLAQAGGSLGLKITNLIFDVYTPSNKTASIIFSTELGNVLDFSYSASASKANYVICGGSGTATGRTFYENGLSPSMLSYGRLESFKNQSTTSDLATLGQAVIAELANQAEQWSVSVTPVDLPQMRALDHYNLGDQVSCYLAGTQLTGIIRTMQFFIDDTQALVTPVIGTPTLAQTSIFGKIFSLTQSTAQRITNLEVA
jgi:hypothetical protein